MTTSPNSPPPSPSNKPTPSAHPDDPTIVANLGSPGSNPGNNTADTQPTMPAVGGAQGTQVTMAAAGGASNTQPTMAASQPQSGSSTNVTHVQVDHPSGNNPTGTHHGQIWGDFELGKLLGKGGMGAVYKGRQISLDRPVAIKVLPPHLSSNPDFRSRFQIEAKAVATIQSPHVIQVYAAGQHQGHNYFAMEYVEGDDLGARLKGGWTPSHKEALQLVMQAARGLAAAGEHGIIHRDIKPANMMLTQKGVLKLMDFGLAKLASKDTGLTMAGTIMGTVNYFSPEQGRGEPCDCRTDIYALGVVLYELLTRRLPFTGQDPTSIIYQHIHQAPKSPKEIDPQIPEMYQGVVLKCLQKKPDDRYQTAQELVDDLEAIAQGRSPQTAFMQPEALRHGGDVVRSEPFASEGRAKRTGLWIGAAVVVVAASIGGYVLLKKPISSQPGVTTPATAAPSTVGTTIEKTPTVANPATMMVVPDTTLARGHVANKRWPEARAVIAAALADFPNSEEWLTLQRDVRSAEMTQACEQADAALVANDVAGAVTAYTLAKGLMPDDPRVVALTPRIDAARTQLNAQATALADARAAIIGGDDQRAEHILTDYLTTHGDDLAVSQELQKVQSRRAEIAERDRAAKEHVENGQRALERKDYDSALLAFTAALQHQPGSKPAREGLSQVTKIKEQLSEERSRFDSALVAGNLAAAKASLTILRGMAPGSAMVVLAENDMAASKLQADADATAQKKADDALQARIDGLLAKMANPALTDDSLMPELQAVQADLQPSDPRRVAVQVGMVDRGERRLVVQRLQQLDAAVMAGSATDIRRIVAVDELAQRLARLATYDDLVFVSELGSFKRTDQSAESESTVRHALHVFPERLLRYQLEWTKVSDGWRITAAKLEAP